jgi:two-component system, LytTR family, response regulator
MTVIIVDDEKHCREVLRHLLQKYCSEVKIIADCSSGTEALAALEKELPDILFLDIEMPVMNGFDLLEKFKHINFEIVFTTAYNEYAIKAIKHSALDYLLKPLDKDELILAVQRAKTHKAFAASQRVEDLLQILKIKKQTKHFAVPTLEGLIMVDAETIAYCESEGAYCKIYFINSDQPLIISKPLKEVNIALTSQDFCRIHNSYLINTLYVQSYLRGEGGEVVLKNGIHLPVSRTRKQEFLNIFQKI